MSAKTAEALAKVADLHAQLAEAYTELSGSYDAETAKSGKAGGDGAAGKVSGNSGKAGVGPKGAAGSKGSKGGEGDDDLPQPTSAAGGKGGNSGKGKASNKKAVTEDDVRAAAKQVIEKFDKDTAVEILSEFGSGKLADVDEADYGACLKKLQAKLAEEDEGDEAEGEDDI